MKNKTPTYCKGLIDVVRDLHYKIDLSKYKRYHVCYGNEWFLIKTIGTTTIYLN